MRERSALRQKRPCPADGHGHAGRNIDRRAGLNGQACSGSNAEAAGDSIRPIGGLPDSAAADGSAGDRARACAVVIPNGNGSVSNLCPVRAHSLDKEVVDAGLESHAIVRPARFPGRPHRRPAVHEDAAGINSVGLAAKRNQRAGCIEITV